MTDQPAPRPGTAHQQQAFAAPPPLLVVPPPLPIQPIAPDRLPGRPPVAHLMQAWAGPNKAVSKTVLQPLQPVTPVYLPGRPRRVHEYQSFASPGRLVAPVAPAIPGIGDFGTATFVLSLQPGTKITYSWPCEIIKMDSGREQRISYADRPEQTFDGSAFLLDGGSRDVRGALMRGAARGATYVLALPYEELLITADSLGNVISVGSTAQCDWAQPGQRCIIQGRDGSTVVTAIVQSSTPSTITVAIVDSTGHVISSALGLAGLAGGAIMPVIQVLLEPQQGFSRYPVAVDMWTVRARASIFGWAGVNTFGRGTSITTYTAGQPVLVTDLVDNDLLIWDRPNAIDGTASEAMVNAAEVIDMGGSIPYAAGEAVVPDWVRPLRITSTTPDDWAWFKAFIFRIRGRQSSFLLSTNRPDLIYVETTPTGGLKVQSASVSGAGDYVSWFASTAHRRLVVTIGGAPNYVAVTAAVDNGDGTTTLSLSPGIAGVATKISFLEQVRIDNSDTDDIQVSWDGPTFTAEMTVRATQDILNPPLPRMFDKVISIQYFYPPLPFPAGPALAVGTLGAVTLVEFTSDRTQTLIGFTATGGNTDGQVICIVNMNLATGGMQITHEDASSPASSRFRMPNLGGFTGTGNAMWFRYDGTAQRWISIMST